MSHTPGNAQDILFGDASGIEPGRANNDENLIEDAFDRAEALPVDGEDPSATPKRQSMYVELLNDMIVAVCDSDGHLFTKEEKDAFDKWTNLDYHARYLLARLALRKEGKLHRLESLQGYERELHSKKNILSAIEKLCAVVHRSGSPEPQVKTEPDVEIIDLTMSDEDQTADIADPDALFPFAHDEGYYADDELHILLDCLKLEDLREICKSIKVKSPTTKRSDYISAILHNSDKQTTLPYRPISSSKPILCKRKSFSSPRISQHGISTKRFISRLDRIRDMVMNILEKCIRVNPNFIKLLRRVSLVYFRSTMYTPTIMTDAILARAKKRYYAAYEYQRTSDIWETREQLLEYERALAVEANIDTALDTASQARSVMSKTPAPVLGTPQLKHKTPVTPGMGPTLATPRHKSKTPANSGSPVEDNKENIAGGDDDDADILEDDAEKVAPVEETKAAQSARLALEIFEREYPGWQALVATKPEVEKPPSLARFEAGYVLTRVIYKGQRAFGAIKDYNREIQVLEALLAQRRWRRGKRGDWYERLALILTTHIKDFSRAYHVVREALDDNDTHFIYRPKLVRRLQSLEKKLNTPEGQRVNTPTLSPITSITIEGDRDWAPIEKRQKFEPRTPARKEDKTQQTRLIASASKSVAVAVHQPTEQMNDSQKWKGKSKWFGLDKEALTVEEVALQHYETKGYKGFHCEGGLLKTVFGMLFWDILFAASPGAFETRYQNAPLDLLEDTFYFARKEQIELRLDEIIDGGAGDLLDMVDSTHREARTLCIGVNWDFSREDLLEIAECIEGKALASICRAFCEDYGKRMSGMPDLFLWDPANKRSLFSEVKGPNDQLAEHQKVWIEALNRAGAAVEVCHVVDRGAKPRNSKKKPSKRKKSDPGQEVESEDDNGPLEKRPKLARVAKSDTAPDVRTEVPPPPATPTRARIEVVSPRSGKRFSHVELPRWKP